MHYKVEVKWIILDVLNSQGEKTDNPYKVDESVMVKIQSLQQTS